MIEREPVADRMFRALLAWGDAFPDAPVRGLAVGLRTYDELTLAAYDGQSHTCYISEDRLWIEGYPIIPTRNVPEGKVRVVPEGRLAWYRFTNDVMYAWPMPTPRKGEIRLGNIAYIDDRGEYIPAHTFRDR